MRLIYSISALVTVLAAPIAAEDLDMRVFVGYAPGISKYAIRIDTSGSSNGKNLDTDTAMSGGGKSYALELVGTPTDSGLLFGFGYAHRVHAGDGDAKTTAEAGRFKIGWAKALDKAIKLEVPLTLMAGAAKENATQSRYGYYGAAELMIGASWTPVPHLVIAADAGYEIWGSSSSYDDPRANPGITSVGNGATVRTSGGGLCANVGIGYRF